MEVKESLQRRYLQTLGALMDEDASERRWVPVLSIGTAGAAFINAACHAARSVDRDVIILELFADDRQVVQHRVQAAYTVGKTQRRVRDCVLWVPDAAGHAVIVPRTGPSRFRVEIDADGRLRRHVGLPAADITFGAALAARRLRDVARDTVADETIPVLAMEAR